MLYCIVLVVFFLLGVLGVLSMKFVLEVEPLKRELLSEISYKIFAYVRVILHTDYR